MKKYLLPLIIIVVALALASSLFHDGWLASHDGVYHILRAEEAKAMLRVGSLPLRWAGNFDEGFGIPLFNFIYPLPYYATAILMFAKLNVVLAVKLVIFASYALGGLGFYLLFAARSRLAGVFASIVYLATPYQFLNIFVRGAMGEVMALGAIPWVLLSFWDLQKNKRLSWYHPLPLAILLLSHNFLGILFLVFLLGYLVFSASMNKRTLLSLGLSLGLAAFFLLPMILERSLLYSFYNDDFTFRFDQHFVYPKQFIYGKWDYWYSVPGPSDGMSFQLGFAQILTIILSTLYILIKKRTLLNLFLVFAYAATLFLMTSPSTAIWTALPLLQTVQFPWRLLFMTALLAPLLASIPLLSLQNKKLRIICVVLLLALAFYNVRNYRTPIEFLDKEEYGALYTLNLTKTATTFRTELLPKWSPPEVRYKSDDVLVARGNIILDAINPAPNRITFTANNKENIGEVTILRNYFPSWHVRVDGVNKDALISPRDDGTISLMLDPGVHKYQIYIGSTKLELISNLVTLISFTTILVFFRKSRAI